MVEVFFHLIKSVVLKMDQRPQKGSEIKKKKTVSDLFDSQILRWSSSEFSSRTLSFAQNFVQQWLLF